jgi:ADP-ribose pyrophosphatase YjhB (NUDIX family)
VKYCSNCGSAVSQRIPPGDNRERFICDSCATIHYQNPKIVAGCIPEWDGRILLCKRAIQPRYGLWTLPAGFMENGETTEQAAIRETLEEAGARIDTVSLYCMFSIPHINQVYLFFRGKVVKGEYTPGIESLECRLYRKHEIPWDELAFPVVSETLLRYYSSLEQNDGFPLQTGVIIKRPARDKT